MSGRRHLYRHCPIKSGRNAADPPPEQSGYSGKGGHRWGLAVVVVESFTTRTLGGALVLYDETDEASAPKALDLIASYSRASLTAVCSLNGHVFTRSILGKLAQPCWANIRRRSSRAKRHKRDSACQLAINRHSTHSPRGSPGLECTTPYGGGV